MSGRRGGAIALLLLAAVLGLARAAGAQKSDERYERLDALAALWTHYQFRYVQDGRVVSLDEGGITTSEGQGYAMLRAVWSGDEETFESAWRWTKQNLRVRGDELFAWKWKDGVVDHHAATDADTDIALALLLAARRFDEPTYRREALAIVRDIWSLEILPVGEGLYPIAGDWARHERYPVVHVGYLAPYAYQEFAKLDSEHPWERVAKTSYAILRWLYFDEGVKLPPEKVYLDRESQALRLAHPESGEVSDFGYDVFPIFWRIAADARWNWRVADVGFDVFPLLNMFQVETNGEWRKQAELAKLHGRMLAPLRAIWEREGRIYDRYRTDGDALSDLEALPLYATLHSFAALEDEGLASELDQKKLTELRAKAVEGRDTPYYLHNWLWFDEALSLGEARRFDEMLGFLLPFDYRSFQGNLPIVPLALCLALFPLAHLTRGSLLQAPVRFAFLACAFAVAFHYLWWRGTTSLNFIEPFGPFISISLLVAELYCFGSILLLVVQVGIGRGHRARRPPRGSDRQPMSVDVLVPVFHEPLEVLEETLLAARAMEHPRTTVYVLDDGHREEVWALARRLGVHYLRGPRRHAKAGNLNHALGQTRGDLVAVFDTDHVPVESFLTETVPWFRDPAVGLVQTPHHFRNPDIFQRAFRMENRVPNEADLFNRGIQPARDGWGGAFFVGSAGIFRRRALEAAGGFQTLSITEDIHTSLHVHAAGWRSVYVDKPLAVGLAAENLSSYLVQRRRWMIGCLQVFFRDNPLLRRGLSLRQRLGYFASLYYFFFPVARIVFWLTPLYYLFFHLHPIFSEVAVLTGRLLPYLLIMPLISSVLLPRWPRPFWGPFYESAVSAPLAWSFFGLLLPGRLGFKVTPKGIVTEGRRFDLRSSLWTLLFAGLTLAALVKGAWELAVFGIERDAYFFNMVWASYNLLFLGGALLLAWERPQRRQKERVRCEVAARIEGHSRVHATTRDLSLSGCSLVLSERVPLPPVFDLVLNLNGGLRVQAELAYHERLTRRDRLGVRFIDPSGEARRAVLLEVFGQIETWERARAIERRGRFALAASFLIGLAGSFRRDRVSRRRYPTRRVFALPRRLGRNRRRSVWLRDLAPHGVGLLCTGRRPRIGELWRISDLRWGRVVHARRRLGLLWKVGVGDVDPPSGLVEPEWDRAA